MLKVITIRERAYGFKAYAWYMRVCFVAILVCNLPHTWSLIIDLFPRVRTWSTENTSNSAPRFWQEQRSRRSLLWCVLRRKTSVEAPSSIQNEKLVTGSVDMSYPQPTVESKLPAHQRFRARMDAAVIGRMIDGELEDEIDLEMITSRKVMMDIEKAVATAKSEPDRPDTMDSGWTPRNSAGYDRDPEKGGGGSSKDDMGLMG